MNKSTPDMLNCAEMTVLERQRGRTKWQQQICLPESHLTQQETGSFQHFPADIPAIQDIMKTEGFNSQNGARLDLGNYPLPNFPAPASAFVSAGFGGSVSGRIDYGLSRTSSSRPLVREEKPVNSKMTGKESSRKRKVDKIAPLKANQMVDDTREKRIKGQLNDGESKITEQNPTTTKTNNNSSSVTNRESSADTSKENSKVTAVQKPDYIHVRARRGQATDSHSLAERVRREKISERMKYLQDLVPGCNKIMGKAGMLDEIINYVQSLQRQVEFLSMRLAAVNLRLDLNFDNIIAKEMLLGCNGGFSTIGLSPELSNPVLVQFNQMQQAATCCGLDMPINTSDLSIRRTISAPDMLPDTFMDPYFRASGTTSNTWDIDLSTLHNADFQHGRQSVLPSQPFTGNLELNNLKTEM